MPNRKPLRVCQRRLLTVWIVGSLPPFVAMFIQSLNDYFKESNSNQEAWGWLLSALMPTLSLMVGSFIAMNTGKPEDKSVDSVVFWLAILFSLVFLSVVNGTIFYVPFSPTPALATMHRANLALGALQGVVGTCLGVFFVSGHKSETRSRES